MYELDYWGLSFREGLEFLLKREPEGPIALYVSDYPGLLNSMFLEREQHERLKYVRLDAADYFLSNHRQPTEFGRFRRGLHPYRDEVYSIEVGGSKILGVYQLD